MGAWVHSVQALRKPRIHVERHGGVRQRAKGALVEGDGVLQQRLEILPVERDSRGPQDALPFILGEPQIKLTHDLALVGRDRLVRRGNSEAKIGGSEARKL